MRGALRGSVFHNTLWQVKLHKCRTSDGPSHQYNKRKRPPPHQIRIQRSEYKKTNPVKIKIQQNQWAKKSVYIHSYCVNCYFDVESPLAMCADLWWCQISKDSQSQESNTQTHTHKTNPQRKGELHYAHFRYILAGNKSNKQAKETGATSMVQSGKGKRSQKERAVQKWG